MAGAATFYTLDAETISSTEGKMRILKLDDAHNPFPADSDVTGIAFDAELDPAILRVHFVIGGRSIFAWTREDIAAWHENVLACTLVDTTLLPLSRAYYQTFWIELEWDRDYIRSKCTRHEEGEFKEVIEYAGEEVEYYDAEWGEFRFGKRVHRKEVPTGNTVTVYDPITVVTPRVTFTTVTAGGAKSARNITVPYWQRINLQRHDVKLLTEQHGLRYDECGNPWVKNKLRMVDGMAGPAMVF